jgi:histidinol-phosphate aminotransferase
MDPLRHVKPAVRDLTAYALARREVRVKINQNENPWDMPREVKERVLAEALRRPWSRYPDFDARELKGALARLAGWQADGVVVGNGSNELIQALLLVTVGASTPVVIPEPTFSLYAHMTTVLGGVPVRVPMLPPGEASVAPDAQFRYDVRGLLDARRRTGAPVIVVCSPNNPTGTSLALEAIEALCADGDGLVAVDEAYHEFAGETAVPLLERHPNLVVLRTFSKAMALAGLRVGYLLASPALVREIDKARLPYNVNFFSCEAAIAAVEGRETLESTVGALVSERERVLGRLADVPGVRALASRANFFLIELQWADPKAVFAGLLRRGVLVRDVTSYPMLSRCLRVSVGSAEENDLFLHALGAALAEAGRDVTMRRA